LQFDKEAVIAIAGATFGIFVNNEEQCVNTKIRINEGDCIKFTPPKNGWRGYLAIQGGFDAEVVLGSKSMYLGITETARIEKGATLNPSAIPELLKTENKVIKPLDFDSEFIDVFKGPEYEILDDKTKENLINNNFKVHQYSNRMAIQIDGLGEVEFDDILTVPVQPGTVQITPSGKLLILMRDAQTTGGYPRVFQLTNDAVNKLAQKRPNDKIVFRITAI
jgi:allophanate hydrolase subunit 2